MTDPRNYEQRIFDELDTECGTSVDDLEKRTRLNRATIVAALDRLRLGRCLQPTDRIGGVNLYRRRVDAERPTDRRGGRRKQEQEAA